MKKNIKIILVFIILISLTTVCFAGGYAINPDAFGATYNTDISKAKAIGEKILGYIVNIAAVSSVAIIAFLGIKFMLGSVDQRAEYKKSFMPLIVGMFVVLGASSIIGIFFDTFKVKERDLCALHQPQGTGVDLGECSAGVICYSCGRAGHLWVEDTQDHFYCIYCDEQYTHK